MVPSHDPQRPHISRMAVEAKSCKTRPPKVEKTSASRLLHTADRMSESFATRWSITEGPNKKTANLAVRLNIWTKLARSKWQSAYWFKPARISTHECASSAQVDPMMDACRRRIPEHNKTTLLLGGVSDLHAGYIERFNGCASGLVSASRKSLCKRMTSQRRGDCTERVESCMPYECSSNKPHKSASGRYLHFAPVGDIELAPPPRPMRVEGRHKLPGHVLPRDVNFVLMDGFRRRNRVDFFTLLLR